jgi:5-(carboxyamino)imidazole ribonucleotide mutase
MKAAVIMGSATDLPVLENTIKTLKSFGVEVEAHVISAHRTPDRAHEFAASAEESGIEVIIAAAGKAAHLAGVIAAYTTLPVIGLPVKSSTMDGLDSLLSTVQMPPGVPVATVAIDGAENAALLAVQIISLKYPELKVKLKDHKRKLAEKVIEADKNLQKEINI